MELGARGNINYDLLNFPELTFSRVETLGWFIHRINVDSDGSDLSDDSDFTQNEPMTSQPKTETIEENQSSKSLELSNCLNLQSNLRFTIYQEQNKTRERDKDLLERLFQDLNEKDEIYIDSRQEEFVKRAWYSSSFLCLNGFYKTGKTFCLSLLAKLLIYKPFRPVSHFFVNELIRKDSNKSLMLPIWFVFLMTYVVLLIML